MIRVHELLSGFVGTRRKRLLVAGEVVEEAVCNYRKVIGEV
jgi:hypothetical protein